MVNENIEIAAQSSFTKQWLNNTSFDSPIQPTWYPKYGDLGDPSDVIALPDIGQANYTILGDSGEMEIDNSLSSVDWSPHKNPDLPILPDTYVINSSGCYVSHLWHEDNNQTRNRPSVHWKRTINMPVNMSDYVITSASLDVIFNASVSVSPHAGTAGGIDREGDVGLDVYSSGDSADFYVSLNDAEETLLPIPIATNNTGAGNLGQDSPAIGSFPDSQMDTIPESVLIDALTSVLSSNGINFTITLGIDIYCEDNEIGVDVDRWNSLIIRSFNLTFSYVKKIDQFTSVSWNQDADSISDLSNYTVIVNEALLNFKYKIDQNWPTSAQNSELRILINNNKHPETVKLSTGTTSFQEAKIGGFDITSLIINDVNLSIEVFLADEFNLDRNITISIDDVVLNISYTIIFPDKQTDLHLFLNSANKTEDPDIDIYIGDSLNITVKYLNKTGTHIPNATVELTGNFTGDLEESAILEQYSITINTDISDAGVNFLTIIAQAEDYETRIIYIIVRINKFPTQDLQVILNNQDVTPDPYINLIFSETLNITLKYNLPNGTHIPGADILLTSETFSSYINESAYFEQYSIVIDTNQNLKIGTNLLTVTAQTESLQTKVVEITVSIRKIVIAIVPVSGSSTIETKPGSDVKLQIRLNNTDFGGFITGAVVTYTWEGGSGILADLDNDGIYEANITDVPKGTYPIVISAFYGDKYLIEDYEIIIAAISEKTGENTLFPILFTLITILIAGLIIYIYAYQTYLKYPKQVRKVRKYRKTLKRKSTPNIIILGSSAAFKVVYNENLGKSSSDFRLKRSSKPILSPKKELSTDKAKSTQSSEKLESEALIDKSIEKKSELDKLVDDLDKK
ncbi:MAG: hypothetical protein ACFFA3_03645 [Promethearchaeota archaeon]